MNVISKFTVYFYAVLPRKPTAQVARKMISLVGLNFISSTHLFLKFFNKQSA